MLTARIQITGLLPSQKTWRRRLHRHPARGRAGTVWLAQLGPHAGYAAGVLGLLILAAIGTGT